MNRGQAELAKLNRASLVEQTSRCDDDDSSTNIHLGQEVTARHLGDVETSDKSESRWATYADNAEESGARPEDDSHDLDQFNRVVVGRVEKSETTKQVTPSTRQRKPPAPRAPSCTSIATLTSNQPPSARHMPYKRPDPQADTQIKAKPTFSQALASIAQRGCSAKPSAVTTTSINRTSEAVAASNSRSVQSDKVETQDIGKHTGASKWNHFDSNDSDVDSEDSQS
ncbi:hypothetical protein GGH93_002714 [Coemansia aciculifera]|nr:hypothetical protein GGH93_002714 [Coemansia aciculifera]